MRKSPVHYIAPSSISIIPNCNETSSDLAVYIARQAKIRVYSPACGIDMQDSTYQEWTLRGLNRSLADYTTPYTIYARLNKTDKTDAYIVFAPKTLLGYEKISERLYKGIYADKYSSVTLSGYSVLYTNDGVPVRREDPDYYYIRLGDVSETNVASRTLSFDTGILGTDEYNTTWALNPDGLPLRIDVDCIIDGQDAGQTPFMSWGQSLLLAARLVEGWGTSADGRIDHWEILRNTGNSSIDAGWPGEERAESFGETGNININHTRGASDDLCGVEATVFTIKAWGVKDSQDIPETSGLYDNPEDDGSSEDITPEPDASDIVVLAQTSINVLAETAEDEDLPISIYRWYKEGLQPLKPTDTSSEEPVPADGDAAGAGNVFPVNNWSKSVPDRPATGEWALWMCFSTKHTGTGTIDPWSGLVRISGTKGDPGEDGSDREYIYMRQATFPFDGTSPADIQTGEVSPQGIADGNDSDKTKDDWVPNGWSDTALPATAEERFVYMSIREKPAGNNRQWGAFINPILWSNWGVQGTDGDGVQYCYKLFDHLLTKAEQTSNIPDNIVQNANGEWIPAGEGVNADWSDDPLSPTPSMPYCYCSVIKRINGEWGQFGELGLWSVYSESGLTADLDNEMDAFGTDVNGQVMIQQTAVAHVVMNHGMQPQTITGLNAVVRRSDTNSVISDTDIVEATVTGVGSYTCTLSVTIKQQDTTMLTYDIYVDISATCAVGTRSLRFSLKRVASGAPGVSPTMYQLLPSLSSIIFSKGDDGESYTPTSRNVTCGYTETTGDTTTPHPDDVSTGDYNIYWRKTTVASYARLTAQGVTVYPTDSYLEFILCRNTDVTVVPAEITGVIDRETIPVVKDGLDGRQGDDGESAFTMDIDNEHDAFAVDNRGIVENEQTRTTHVHLFFGSQRQLLTANPGVTIVDASTGAVIRQSETTIQVTTATGQGSDEGTVGITVYPGYTMPEGIYADISALCAKGPMTVRFSLGISKSGEDGLSPTIWNLAPTLSEFSFARDTDGTTLTPEVLRNNIYVRQTTGSESILHQSADTISGKSLKIRYGWQEGVPQGVVNVGGVITLSRVTAAANTYVWVELWDAADLNRLTPVSGKTWIDRETIPINKDGIKGQDGSGSNAVRADIDNESDSLPCDSEGNVVTAFSIISVARIYDGADPVAADGHSTATDIVIAGITPDIVTEGVTDNGVRFTWSFPVGHHFDNDRYSVLIRLTRGGRNYYVSFSATVVRSGAPGVSPTIYRLAPTSNSINFSRRADNTLITSSITVGTAVEKMVGNSRTKYPSGQALPATEQDKIRLMYRFTDATGRHVNINGASVSSAASDNTADWAWLDTQGDGGESSPRYTVTALAAKGFISLELAILDYSSAHDRLNVPENLLLDLERIPVLYDGVNGTDGTDGHDANPNILLRTMFNNGIDHVKEKWAPRLSWGNISVDNASDTTVSGHKSIRIVAPLDNYEDLTQHVYEYNVHQGVKTNTWYTLSFYSFSTKQQSSTSEEKFFLHTYVYPESDSACIDISQVYVDGVQKTLSTADGDVGWANAWTGVRHTFTFKTLSSFPTNYVDVKFRVLAGGIGCICMPKLEEGMVATPYVPNDDDLQGADGKDGSDAWTLTVSPSPIIINQSTSNESSFGLPVLIDFVAKCGDQDATVGAVTAIQNMGLTISRVSTDNHRLQITAINKVNGSYATYGTIDCTVPLTCGTRSTSMSVRIEVAVNLLGTWAMTVRQDAITEAGTLVTNKIDENNEIIRAEYTGAIERSATGLTQQFTEQMSRAGADGRNLFGFNNKVHFDGAYPFIQGYGLVCTPWTRTSDKTARIYNLGMYGRLGYYTVSCQVRTSSSTAFVRLQMNWLEAVSGTTAATDGIKGVVQASWSSWVTLTATFLFDNAAQQHIGTTLQPGQEGSFDLSDINGYIDIGEIISATSAEKKVNNGNHIYVRHLKVEYKDISSAFCESDEDIASIGQGQQISTLALSQAPYQVNYPITHGGRSNVYHTYVSGLSNEYPWNDERAFHDYIRQVGGINLSKGKCYTLSFWAKSSVDGFVITNHLYKAGQNIIDLTQYDIYVPSNNETIREGISSDGCTRIQLSTSWAQYFVRFYVVRDITDAAVIPLRVEKNENYNPSKYIYRQSANIYMSDIELQEGYVMSESSFSSLIEQNARRISLVQQSGTRRSGIDIQDGTVNLFGDRVTFSNSDGTIKDMVWIDPDDGTIHAVDGDFKGKVTATSGNIGGFTIDSDRLYNSNWEAGIDISYDNNNKAVRIGKNARGALGNEQAIIRAESTKGDQTYNTALYLNAANATYNYAFYGNGNGVLNGLVFGFKTSYITVSSIDGPIGQLNLTQGATFIFDGAGGNHNAYPPTLTQVRACLGLQSSSSTPFSIEIELINETSGSVLLYFRGYTGIGSDYPYLMSNNGNTEIGGAAMIELTRGAYLKLRLTYTLLGYRAHRLVYNHD